MKRRELVSRPLGKPMTSGEIADLTASVKDILAKSTAEDRRQRLIRIGVLDENGQPSKEFYPDII